MKSLAGTPKLDWGDFPFVISAQCFLPDPPRKVDDDGRMFREKPTVSTELCKGIQGHLFPMFLVHRQLPFIESIRTIIGCVFMLIVSFQPRMIISTTVILFTRGTYPFRSTAVYPQSGHLRGWHQVGSSVRVKIQSESRHTYE